MADRSQNVVRVEPDGTLGWVVEPVELPTTGAFHESVQYVNGKLIAETNPNRFTEIDLNSGSVVDSWPADQFVVVRKRHQLDDVIESFEEVNGGILLQTEHRVYWFDSDGARLAAHEFNSEITQHSYTVFDGYTLVATGDPTTLKGFDESGALLWKRTFERKWALSEQPDAIHLYTQVGKQRHTTLEVGPKTGRLVGVSGPTDQFADLLDG